jgi:hypothetical protein
LSNTWVRPFNKKEIPLLERWLKSTPRNLVDWRVFSYPTIKILTAIKRKMITAFLPTQVALVLESLAIRPENSATDTADALGQLVRSATLLAHEKGIREIILGIGDPSTEAFAIRHGFSKLDFPVYRLRLDDLEPDAESPDTLKPASLLTKTVFEVESQPIPKAADESAECPIQTAPPIMTV